MMSENSKNRNDISKTWPDLVHDFLNSPPTSSFFRVYFLSFFIWNKGVILYILFGGADMADKLAFVNWSKYVAFHGCNIFLVYSYIYVGPLIISLLFYFIVFYRIFPMGLKKYSLYNYFYANHVSSEIDRGSKDVEKVKQDIDLEKNKISLLQEKEKNKPKDLIKNSAWEKDYLRFKKTTYLSGFEGLIKRCYANKRNVFTYSEALNVGGAEALSYLIEDRCIETVIPEQTISMSNQGVNIKFNLKGEYYIKYYEWENNIS